MRHIGADTYLPACLAGTAKELRRRRSVVRAELGRTALCRTRDCSGLALYWAAGAGIGGGEGSRQSRPPRGCGPAWAGRPRMRRRRHRRVAVARPVSSARNRPPRFTSATAAAHPARHFAIQQPETTTVRNAGTLPAKRRDRSRPRASDDEGLAEACNHEPTRPSVRGPMPWRREAAPTKARSAV